MSGSGPGARDRTVDAVRAFAVAGVVSGHWLVTGLVPGADGLRTASPLAAMPAGAPVTWLLQTLGLFFFAGGFAAARARSTERPRPAGSPLRRHARPVLGLLAVWAPALLLAAALGVPATTLRTIATLVVSPLWFLLPYLALSAATGALRRVLARFGPVVLLVPVAVVAATDAGLLPGLAAVPAAWAVPWLLGILVADHARGTGDVLAYGGAALACAGAAAMVALVRFGHYPASAVGVPGAGRSNLFPPSLVAVALAVTQTGVFLLLRAPLARLLRRDRLWRPIAALNRVAVGVYLGHQSVLLAVAGAAALVSPAMPGLLTAPTGPGWVAARVLWLPVLATVLAVMTGVRHHGEPGCIKRALRGTLFDGSQARTTDGGDRCAR
ncbi:acyltransferase family protein [Actinoplanes sp. NPDC049118]|uniref:acyltransferase family protein n=1 Tax=Actinoplanes sp. NPDC049118 TaxID=3155769 RepID=UPI0033F5B795